MRKSRAAAAVVVGVLALFACMSALAQTYPTRPIRYIVPQAPGGSSDTLARTLVPRLAESMGQQVVVDNRPGATGIVGGEIAVRAVPDGHTLLQVATSHATNPAMQAKLPYDTLRDFEPIILLSQQPNLWLVHPALPVKSINELVAYVKARPGQINFASSGTGGSQHLAGELLKSMAGVDMVHVPYKGSPPALIDLLAGRVPVMTSTMPPALPHIRSGRVRVIAVTSAQRSAALPDVPTVAASGVPGYEAIAWQGLVAPARTPAHVVARVNGELARILGQAEVSAKLRELGFETVASTPDQFAAYIRSEIAKWSKVIKAAGITPN